MVAGKERGENLPEAQQDCVVDVFSLWPLYAAIGATYSRKQF